MIKKKNNRNFEDVRKIFFKEVLKNKKLKKNFIDLRIGDIPEWDSMSHINFLLSIEKRYKIKFNMSQIAKLNSIKKIKSFLFNEKN